MLQSRYNLPPGWMSDEELDLLREYAKGENVLEVGSHLGRSTVAMAQVAWEVVTIDNHAPDTHARLLHNLQEWEVAHKVVACRMHSHSMDMFAPAAFHFILIDGDHSTKQVIQDIGQALFLLDGVGFLALHDYIEKDGATVAPAAKHYLDLNRMERIESAHTLAIFAPVRRSDQ